jgi:deoxycytidine triphosphate deaminase
MAIKSDKWIRRMALEHQMIEPFEARQVRSGVISYGLSSYGYDIRVADEFKVFTNVNNALISIHAHLSTSRQTPSSSRRIRSPWRGRLSTSGSRVTS